MKNDKLILERLKNLRTVFWTNPMLKSSEQVLPKLELGYQDILDAKERLQRFAPLIQNLFPETEDGIIESPIRQLYSFGESLMDKYKSSIQGHFVLKCDNELKVAGSIKARGGIYEVLKYAELVAFKENIIKDEKDTYSKLNTPSAREVFSKYRIVVGSTGNLGMSIGIMAASLGFETTVHMSHEAKQWKKNKLSALGVEIIEHQKDYGEAVAQGRKQCECDEKAYFVDDERSKDLFLGYSVAALGIKDQFEKANILVDSDHLLYVYLPCGVGGAAGGITFGLKHIYGDAVKCYFAEPTHSPCMTLGLVTERYDDVHVNEYGIDNLTEADGLAVGKPSSLVCEMMKELVDGVYTVDDIDMFTLLALLKDTENIKIEPSSATALIGPMFTDCDQNGTHLCWMTGGSFVPDDIYNQMYLRGKNEGAPTQR